MNQFLRFDGRVAVVTGGGAGLGREYALLLASRGARVVVNDVGGIEGVGRSRAEAVAAEIVGLGGEAVADTSSVATAEGGRSLVGTALKAWGRLDIVVNNAGNPVVRMPFADLDDQTIDDVMDVHFRGTVNVLRPAWPLMISQGYGRILNTSSGSILGEGEDRVAYYSAKAAIIGLTRNLGLVGGPRGIVVNALMPIAFTERLASLEEPIRSWAADNFGPETVAPVAAFLVHESVPCSGELFSAGAGRFARVVLSETTGVTGRPLTLEEVGSRFAEAMDTRDAHTLTGTAAELELYAEQLGVRWGA